LHNKASLSKILAATMFENSLATNRIIYPDPRMGIITSAIMVERDTQRKEKGVKKWLRSGYTLSGYTAPS
jgi:hypothetical protein